MKLNNSSSWDKRQILCVQKWANANYDGVITAFTSFGKTRGIAFRAINLVKPKSILISVPSLVLKKDWEHLLSTTKIPHEVVVVNTLIRNTYDVDLFIIDEIHRSAAETFIRSFECVKKEKFLGLTASFERNDDRHELILEHTKIIDVVTLTEGLKNKWVDPFEIIKIPIELTTQEKTKLKKINTRYEDVVQEMPGANPMKAAKHWISFLDKKKWVVGKRSKQAMFIKAIENELKRQGINGEKAKLILKNGFESPSKDHPNFANAKLGKEYFRLVNKRKSLLYNAANKLPKTLELIEQYKDEYKFVLSREIKFIEAIKEELPDNEARVYHSKISNKVRDANMKRFDDGRTKVKTLLSVKALNEGVDIPKLSTLIIAAYTSTMIDKVQIFGRALRKYIDKKVTIIYLYVPGSQEETWLNNILRNEKVIKL